LSGNGFSLKPKYVAGNKTGIFAGLVDGLLLSLYCSYVTTGCHIRYPEGCC